MENILKFLLIYQFILSSEFAFGQEHGVYCRTNQAGDYSITKVMVLNEDGSFQYEFKGHLVHKKFSGTFSFNSDGEIFLQYDSTKYTSKELEFAPRQMKYKKGMLLEINEKGIPIKRQRLLSKHRRFLFFGSFSRRKPVYLKKQDDISHCN